MNKDRLLTYETMCNEPVLDKMIEECGNILNNSTEDMGTTFYYKINKK